MPLAASEAVVSGAVAVSVVGVALLLTWRQWSDRSHRPESSSVDARYYQRQDRRRFKGALALALIGLGIGFGSRIDFRLDNRSRSAFLLVWLVVFLLILYLLLLSALDLLATRNYANRNRRALAEERKLALERELARLEKRRAKPEDLGNGRTTPPPSSGT
ncbi:hypothetical protein BH23PLA1_BH23PLA1_17570 [soil metagenome]